MLHFNLQFHSALAEVSSKCLKIPAPLWCALIKKKVNHQGLGTRKQTEPTLFTSPLIQTLPAHMLVLKLTFYQNNQIKNANYFIFLASFYFKQVYPG